ncbi:glycosyl hydrolase family 18 protein [Pseudoneobacillus sp. C159]
MQKRVILLLLIIAITFTGGFFSGITFTKNQKPELFTIDSLPKSTKKPIIKQVPVVQKDSQKVLMGYVQDFRDPTKIDYSHLTHIIFSFAHPTKDGQLLMSGDWALQNLRTMVSKAHEHDTKVILAIGGWYHISGGESYDYFKPAISNPSSRTKLVNEIIQAVDRENLDGIDIDFEHPRSPIDAQNLTAFAKDLSTKLHAKNKQLSIAVNAKVHSVAGTEINNVVYQPKMFEYVDHVNIMAYDGQWDGGYNAKNLSPYPYTRNIVHYWTTLFNNHNLPTDKLVLGVPSYAQPFNPKKKQVSYASIINKNTAYAYRDTVRMNGTTYYYNGASTIQKKTNLALEKGFGGMMIWELGQDSTSLHSLTKTMAKIIKKANLYAQNTN